MSSSIKNFFTKKKEKNIPNNLKEILSNSIERPSSEQVLELKEEEIIEAAKEIGYKLYPKTMKKIYSIHEVFMPIFEEGLISMLSETELKEPDYYAFARDGEIFFDALWGIGQAGEKNLQERVHYLKTSLEMYDDKNNLEYLKEIGIAEERFEKGPSMVFLDSGFKGSLFRKVAKWTGYKLFRTLESNSNFEGYLMKSTSLFKEIDIGGKTIASEMKKSPYKNFCRGDNNGVGCAFMQVTPKFTGRFVQAYQKENGTWDVLPKQNSLISKLKINLNQNFKQISNEDQINSMKKNVSFINEDIVNPVASLLLQKRTLDYFTNPNVHDRIYSKLLKRK